MLMKSNLNLRIM